MRISEFNGQNIVYENDTVILTKTCTISNDIYCVKVSEADYEAWRNGELIQRVFPQLSPDEREFLITGYTPVEWDNIFKT